MSAFVFNALCWERSAAYHAVGMSGLHTIRASWSQGYPKKTFPIPHTHPYFRDVDRGGHTKTKIRMVVTCFYSHRQFLTEL